MTVPTSITAIVQQSEALKSAGRLGAALQRAQEALTSAQALDEPAAMALALVHVADCHYYLGHYDRARSLANQALAAAAPDASSRADAWRILGNCAHEAGDLSAAEEYYRQAIDLGRQLDSRYILFRCLHSLSASVYLVRGQFELALAADQEALRLAQELEAEDEIWLPLVTMGWAYWVTGRRAEAYQVLEAWRDHVEPGSLAEGYYCCLLADWWQGEPDPERALSLYARARSIAEAVGDPALSAELRVGLSRYHREIDGNASAAHEWADDALAIATRAGCHDLRGWAQIERGRAAWALGNLAAAEQDLRATIAFLTPIKASFDLARAYLLLTALLHKQNSPKAEIVWLEAVSRIISGGYGFLLEQERSLALPLLAELAAHSDPAVAAAASATLAQLEQVPPSPLNITTLGGFRVQQARRIIADRDWRGRRAGELFRFLLTRPGRSCLQDQVAEALWPDKAPTSSQGLFHRATSALRRVLEPDLPEKFPSRYLTVDQGRVTLQLPAGSWLDLEVFEEHILTGRWEEALALYRGELFPEDRYADWAAGPRERLAQMALRALVTVARQRLGAGNPAGALEACEQALAMEPWLEEAVMLGMQACVAQRNRVGAARLYQGLERSLREELGIAPQLELAQFYQSLL